MESKIVETSFDRRNVLIGLALLGLGLVLLVLATQNATAANVDWTMGHTVVGTETYTGKVIDVQGEILIPQGTTLILNHTTLNMWYYPEISIYGTLTITDGDKNNSTTADRSMILPATGGWWLYAYTDSNFLMEYSYLSTGYIDISNTNSTLRWTLCENFWGANMNSPSIATFDNNTFLMGYGNRALYAQGDTKVTFTHNYVTGGWGALYFDYGVTVFMKDNRIENNIAPQITFSGYGTLDMNNDTVRYSINNEMGSDNIQVTNWDFGNTFIYIDDCDISNTASWGIGLTMRGNFYGQIQGNINNTKINSNGRYGMYVNYGDFAIDDLEINQTSGDGLYSEYTNLKISNSTFTNNWGDGIYFSGWGDSNINLDLDNVNITYNFHNGLEAYDAGKVTIDNSTIDNNTMNGFSSQNIQFNDIHNSTFADQNMGSGISGYNFNTFNIIDSDFITNGAYGVYLQSNSGSSIITRNLIKANGGGMLPFGSPQNGGLYNVYTQDTNVIFKKNTVQDGNGGFYSSNSGPNIKLELDQNTIKKQSNSGIYIAYGKATITKNTLRNSNGDQISVMWIGSGSVIDNNDVRDGDSQGIRVCYSYVASISGNTVKNHTNSQAVYIYGLYNELHFVKNIVDKSLGGVHYYADSYGNWGLVFDNNTISNTTDGDGFYAEFSSDNGDFSLQNNKIIDNSNYGIYISHYGEVKNAYIRKNTITNATNDCGIYWENLGYSINYMDFSKNTISRSNYAGYLTYMGKLDIRNNIITKNRYYGLEFAYSHGPLNVTDNTITQNCKENLDDDQNDLIIYDQNYNYFPANIQRNTISDNYQSQAFQLYGYGKILFENNIMSNNYYGAEYNGRSLIARNNIYNNNTGEGAFGSYIYGFDGNVHIYNDTANDNDVGLRIDELYEGFNVLIENCNYNDNQDRGLYVSDLYKGLMFKVHNVTTNNVQNRGMYFESFFNSDLEIDNCTVLNSGNMAFDIVDFYSGSSVDLENCTIDGSQYAIYLYNIAGTVEIHDNFIANATYSGLMYYYIMTTTVHVYNNHFYMNYIALNPYRSQTIIEGNLFEGGSYGVYPNNDDFYISSGGQDLLYILRNNTFHGISEYSVRFDMSSFNARSSIYDNTFTNFGTGIYFYGNSGNELPVFNNKFSQGRTAVNMPYVSPLIHDNVFWMVSSGIESYQTHATIKNNTFSDCWNYCIGSWSDKGLLVTGNDFTYNAIGVYSEGSLLTLEGNTFTLNTYGAKINSSFATINGNKFIDNEYGLYIESFSYVSITDGEYSHNTEFGIWSEMNTYSSLEVKDNAVITDDTVLLNGGVTVDTGGVLEVTGSHFSIRSLGSSGYSISIKLGGSLVATGTTFEPFNVSAPFSIEALKGSTIKLKDCVLSHMGTGTGQRRALYIATSDTVLEKVTIKGSPDIALFIEGKVSIAMRNGSIEGSTGKDVFIQNASTLRMGNTGFNKKNVNVLDSSKIIIERIIEVTALDDGDLPYKGVSVSVTDDQGTTTSGTTDVDGKWSKFFQGAIISSTGITDSELNYKLSVTDGKMTFNETVALSDDFMKTYRFGTAPILLHGPTDIIIDEDTTYVLDLSKYFFDHDAMTYSVLGNVSTTYTFDRNTGTLKPAKDWFGHEDVTFVATDTHGLTARYLISITVRPVNDLPVLSGVPNLLLNEDETFRLELMSYIYDPDTPQSGLIVTVSTSYAKVDRTTVIFNYPATMIEWVRITVKDSEGGSSQEILVNVLEVNDPPYIKGVPVLEAVEGIEITVDFKQWISDEDNNITSLILSSSSPYVMSTNGTKMTFLFPDGSTQRFVSLTVSDGMRNTTYLVEFFVSPINDPPVLAGLPTITVTEGEAYIFDLTPYITDKDTNLSKLIVTTDAGYITVDGLNLIILIPESGSMRTVTITVSDSFSSATTTLRIIIKPVNDAPVLSDPHGPKDGTPGSDFEFKVTFKDPDAEHPVVFVVVDGKKYAMTKISGDFTTGAVYQINLKNVLKPGQHSYHFEADDGSGEPNGIARTGDTFDLGVSKQTDNWWLIGLILVILIVFAILLIVGRRKSAPDEPQIEEEPEEEAEKKGSREDEDEAEEEEEDEEEEETEEPEEAEAVQEDEEEEKKAPLKKKKVSRR